MRGQEYVVSLPCGRGMVLETLRYADEVNKASSYFRDIGDAKPDADLLEMAETLIEKKTSDFDAKEFENRYIDALEADRGEAKKKGKRIIQDDEPDRIPKGSNVIDLMAALKKSLGDDKPAARRPAASAAPPSRLPPRSGKKTATRASGLEQWPASPSSTSRPTTASATSRKPGSRAAASSRKGRQLRRPEA